MVPCASPSSKTSHLISSPLRTAHHVRRVSALRGTYVLTTKSHRPLPLYSIKGETAAELRSQPVPAKVLGTDANKVKRAASPRMPHDTCQEGGSATWEQGLPRAAQRIKPGWQLMPANPALRRLRQEDCQECKSSLGYRVRAFLNDNKVQNNTTTEAQQNPFKDDLQKGHHRDLPYTHSYIRRSRSQHHDRPKD